MVVSEFGACYGTEICAREITQVTENADIVLAGWAYWQFKLFHDLTTSAGSGYEGFYNGDGSLQDVKVKALARSYIQAAQGTQKYLHFNTKNGQLKATFTLDTSIEADTIVYISKSYYE